MTKPLEAYTENAFRLLAGKLPEVVYLPPSLRTRSTSKNDAAEDEDQLDRIVKADPLGFLFAIMEGKVLPSFTVKPSSGGRPDAKRTRGRPKKESATARLKIGEDAEHIIYAEFHSPGIADRERVAMFLAKLVSRPNNEPNVKPEEDEFARLCRKRATQAKGDLPHQTET